MRESKIKGKRYRYDPKTGKMVELKNQEVLPEGFATIVGMTVKKEKDESRDARENRETAD